MGRPQKQYIYLFCHFKKIRIFTLCPYKLRSATVGDSNAFAATAAERGIEVIIAGAGGAAHLPGVTAASTPLPVIGVPIRSSNSIEGLDSILSILQMPAGIPVATVALDGARNAAILACQIMANGDATLREKIVNFKAELAAKIDKANDDLSEVEMPMKVN